MRAQAPAIERQPSGEPGVLASGQQRLWFLHQLDPRSPAYNMYQAVRIAGRLDGALLERSLQEVMRRHDGRASAARWNRLRSRRHGYADSRR